MEQWQAWLAILVAVGTLVGMVYGAFRGAVWLRGWFLGFEEARVMRIVQPLIAERRAETDGQVITLRADLAQTTSDITGELRQVQDKLNNGITGDLDGLRADVKDVSRRIDEILLRLADK